MAKNPFLTSPFETVAPESDFSDVPMPGTAAPAPAAPVPSSPKAVKAPVAARGTLPTTDDIIKRAAELNVDPKLALSFFAQESSANWNSKDSPKGARGGMQVMPGTYKMMMGTDAGQNDPWNNLEAGLRYIRYGQDKLKTKDPALLAAGYHAGYDHPDLKQGRIPNTNDGMISTREYARSMANRVGGKRVSDEFEDVSPGKAGADEFEDYVPGQPVPAPSMSREAQEKADNAPYLDRLTEETKSGFDDMTRSLETARWALGGADDIDTAQKIADGIIEQQSKPKTTAQKEIDAAYEDVSKAEGVVDTTVAGAKALYKSITNPKETSLEIARSAANSLPTLASGAVGAGGGAIAGAPFGGVPGAITGAIIGGKAGMAAGTTATELGAEIQYMVQKRLDESKQPATAQNVLAILKDEGFKGEALKQGLAKGLTVAAIDQLFMGIGGKIATAPARKEALKALGEQGVDVSTSKAAKQALASPAGRAAVEAAKPSVGARVGAGAAAIGVDAAGESIGEGTSQFVARGEVDYGDALREGVTSIGQSASQTAAGVAIERGKQAIDIARSTIRPTENAPSDAAGPLARAAENATAQPDRVTVKSPEGEVSGTVTGTAEDGTMQVVSDDGEVLTFKPGENGLTIEPEAPNTPLSNALEVAAADQPEAEQATPAAAATVEPTTPPPVESTQPAPVEAPQAAQPTKATVSPPPQVDYSTMAEPALRERLKYLADQAKMGGGWNTILVKERKKVEKAINALAKTEAPKTEELNREAPAPAVQETTAQQAAAEAPAVADATLTNEGTKPAKLPFASKEDTDRLFGVDAKRQKAMERIAKGTAYFGSKPKADEFITKNGLKDTHTVAKGKAGRWDIVAKDWTAEEKEKGFFVVKDQTGKRVGSLLAKTPEEAINAIRSESQNKQEQTNVTDERTKQQPASTEAVVQEANAEQAQGAAVQPAPTEEVGTATEQIPAPSESDPLFTQKNTLRQLQNALAGPTTPYGMPWDGDPKLRASYEKTVADLIAEISNTSPEAEPRNEAPEGKRPDAPSVEEVKPEQDAKTSPKDDLDSMFDEVLAEEVAKDEAKKQPERTASEALKSSAVNSAEALNNAIDGLGKLFGGNRIGSGLSFDEESYAKAKPLFIEAAKNLKDAGTDIKEAMRVIVRMVLDKFGAEAATKMKPYVIQFAKDVQSGEIVLRDAEEAQAIEKDVEAQQNRALTDFFAGELAKGRMPKDNLALKKMVEAYDGVEPSQERMKVAQEDLEAAIVVESRRLIGKQEGKGDRATFDALVALYNSQPNLNIRTSTSVENQAYSTPSPLAYLSARLANIGKDTAVFEPTAGNGMLLITADPKNATANELDTQRYENLKAQGIDAMQGDALTVVDSGAVTEKSQDAVITNPPFGSIKDQDGKATKVTVGGYKLGKIDHLIAAEALRTMKDDGKAVLIIGADKVAGGLSTDDRIFFNWLYSNYNVTSQFEMDGKLYARQGAGWPVRVIAINGRVESSAVSPKNGVVQRFYSWEQVYEQFEQSLVSQERGIERGAAVNADGAGSTEVGQRPTADAGGQAGQPSQSGAKSGRPVGNVSGERTGTAGNQPRGAQGAVANGTGGQRRNEVSDSQDRLESGEVAQGDARQEAGADQPARNPRTDRVNQLAQAENAFQAKYVPTSEKKDEGVLIPVNMAQPLADAMSALEDTVGDIDEFARKELGYKTVAELHNALMGLQVDSVATAINNIKKGKGTIIADQTGIGKGRQAAAVIRWAAKNGKIPVFITVKPSLFTDMYNDLADIGSNDIAPLIVNGDEAISGQGNEKLFANKPAKHKDTLRNVAASGQLPEGRNAVFLTYSQINTDNVQRQAILSLASQAVFVLDESHNAGGQSSTGEFVLGLLENAAGVTYLSATYAKRPDNMPVYFKTDIGEAVADSETLAGAMARGGLPLQTVVSNNLVKAGQMFRRERSYDGVSITTKNDTKNSKVHEELSDKVTSALRAIVSADKTFHSVYFKKMAEEMAESGGQAYDNAGNQASQSVNHTEFSSVVHNFVRQLLLGLKADTAADEAIAALKRGEKPLIALDNTMGSFLSEYTSNLGIRPGQPLGDFDYRSVLSRALERSRVVSVDAGTGDKVKKNIPLSALDPITRASYEQAQAIIDDLDVSSIPVSPLDWIRYRIEKAGYSVAEITGRDLAVDYSGPVPKLGNVPAAEQGDKVGTTRAFNSGRTDVVILNVSGSTGISLHSSEKFEDKRPRHMIVAQAAQDINIFMQMLGRIHRTGQVNLPSYTLLNVDLPAEKRPTAILSGKMKSLNANTSSNTESATSVQALDILNKYGDQVIANYLEDNQELADALGISDFADGEGKATEDLARKVTGRLALMPVATQRQFYADIEEQYANLIDYLNKTNQNDLEPRTFDFDAIEDKKETLVEKEGDSPFQEAAEYVEFSIKAQGKPMTLEEIQATAKESLGGKNPTEFSKEMLDKLESAFPDFLESMTTDGMKESAIATKNKAVQFIESHPIGSLWRVEINGESYNGAVVNVKNSHKGVGNPYSLSKTTVTLAVNGALRQVSVPATQFEKITVSKLPGGGNLAGYFRTPPEGERDKAKVITGNLLAAYGELNGSGTIINFTKQDGSIEQGILLPKKFEFGRDTAGDYRFKSAKDAVRFLKEGTSTGLDKLGIGTRDGVVRVVLDGSNIEIRVPKSKLRGGKYFLDGPLREVVGDFVSKGNLMVATARPDKQVAAIDALMRKASLYALPSMAAEAKAMISPEATKNPALSRSQEQDRMRYIEDNFYDILGELEDSGKVSIKC